MKLEKRLFQMFGIFSVLVLAALTIASCSNFGVAAQLNDGKLTVCHATGDAATPYDEVTLDFDELTAHIDHENDFIPAPAEGCPNKVETGNNVGKLTICHATGSATNPYNEIKIDFNGLRGHSKHTDDIIPAPQGGCPSITPTPTVTVTAGTPSVTPTPTITATLSIAGDKITICHATGSSKNPYNMITVSVIGLNGHDKHTRDIIPAPAGGCP